MNISTPEERAAFAKADREFIERQDKMQDVPAEQQPPRRMTDAQRDKLWDLCGRYNVPFREDDYFVNPPNGMSAGWVEGWIGGHSHRRGQSRPTIYIGVSPEGDSHS